MKTPQQLRWQCFATPGELVDTFHDDLARLAPGHYDPEAGVYLDDRGRSKCYVSSDNLVDERWTGLLDSEVIEALKASGLDFDAGTRTGVVPHMLSCLALDGRFGFTAIGTKTQEGVHRGTCRSGQSPASGRRSRTRGKGGQSWTIEPFVPPGLVRY